MPDSFIDSIDHVEIYVKDQLKAARWYGDIFDLYLIEELEFWSKNSGPLFVGTQDNSVKLALFQGEKNNDGSIRRIAFRTSGKNFIYFLNRLEKLLLYSSGQKLFKDNVIDHDISFSIYFDDVDGNKLELTCYDYDYVKSQIK